MRVPGRYLALITLGLGFLTTVNSAQFWSELAPLKSTREDVGRLLGRPSQAFDAYESYDRKEGRYYIWYSRGNCVKDDGGRDWKVAPGILTTAVYYPSKLELLDNKFISDFKLAKNKSPISRNRDLYISGDGRISVEVVTGRNAERFIYSVSLEPGNDSLCLACPR